MLIKMALIGVAVVAVVVFFSGELTEMFPRSVGTLDGVDDKLNDLADSTIGAIDTTLDAGISDVNSKVDQLVGDASEFVSDKAEQLGQAVPSKIFAGAQEP